jgi:hypothetical protein
VRVQAEMRPLASATGLTSSRRRRRPGKGDARSGNRGRRQKLTGEMENRGQADVSKEHVTLPSADRASLTTAAHAGCCASWSEKKNLSSTALSRVYLPLTILEKLILSTTSLLHTFFFLQRLWRTHYPVSLHD